MTVDPKTLGERLALVRSRRDWGIATVAAGAGISEARLYRIERGELWPEPAVLAKICQALGVDETALREEGDEWYARLKGIGAISGPHAFDLPTQFDPALQIDGWVPPAPGVRDLTPLPAPEPAPKPQRASVAPPRHPSEPRRLKPAGRDCTICQQRPALFYGVCSNCMRGDW